MQLKNLIQVLEKWAPLADAEDFDNVGLLVGNPQDEINKALVTLDITDKVMEEAINEKADLIITFHPLIFKGLKRLSGASRTERLVVKAIQNKIAIYAIHTNLDAQLDGVNGRISKQLGLVKNQILIPKKDDLNKLVFFVPHQNAEEVKNAIFATGAGTISNYAECSFSLSGEGTFMPIGSANPTLGELEVRHSEPETKVEILVQSHQIKTALRAMNEAHPYEVVAYDLIRLKNSNQNKGMGQIGELEESMTEEVFLQHIKQNLPTQCIRHSNLNGKMIKKVAVLGGSGAFGIGAAKAAGADAYITADMKYHDFFLAENQILLCDIGHYESEQFTKNHITHYIKEIFPNFAILTSVTNTNPINYYI